ncbi:hypothetical protein ACFY4K_34810 [Streptomyces leeuwenhoekii]|uniref:NucA/NucB deoxyribonuclease domain-containing protein n=1 Tax=Streptomyces leeuwenhoekii TaxID=1437453 RepID=UPI0036A71FCB
MSRNDQGIKLSGLRRAAVVSAFLTAFAGSVVPAEADILHAAEAPSVEETSDSVTLVPEITPGSDQPLLKPQSEVVGANLATEEAGSCGTPTDEGQFACFEAISPDDKSPLTSGTTSSAASVAPPQWCEKSTGTPLGNRTQVCQVNAGIYTTYKRVDGVTTVSGQANLLFINYSYGNTGIGRIAHQIEVSAYSGWGEALKASISGKATASDQCTVESSSFPSKPIAPLNSWRVGESFFDTTATNVGDIGRCATTWTISLLNSGQAPVNASYRLDDFRCDNATNGRAGVGCVVSWFPSLLTYSQAKTPNLVRHVTLAQASGLPGATFDAPLERATSPIVSVQNRTLACGDAPSITGKSCDEYPFASSNNGLYRNGGTRRTFTDCDLPNIPSGTGSKGVSVCMIPETEQNIQGGTNTQFYRAERVLDKDPFRVGFRA